MTDYWRKLKLSECWSPRQRYNKVMNYIIELKDSPKGSAGEEMDIEEGD